MAQAILPQPTPRTPSRRTPPDPARVFETYLYECQSRGEWGAYTRTGQRYDRTPEWARKTIAKYRAIKAAQEAAAVEVDEFAYVPPPNAYPEPAPVVIPTPTLAASNSSPTAGASITSSTNGDAPALQLTTGGEFQPDEPGHDEPQPAGPPHPSWQHQNPRPRPHSDAPSTPGHARPDVNEPGSEAPELPQESFDNPQPNQPPPASQEAQPPIYQSTTNDLPTSPKLVDGPAPIIIRQIVRVPLEPAQLPLVAWWQAHAPPVQMLTAIVAFLFLVVLTWLG